MRLRSIIRGAANAVHRDRQITWKPYGGYTIDPNTGIATPAWGSVQVYAQIQPLPTQRLAQLENLNIQGVLRQVYLNGAVASAVREDGSGGDLLVFPEMPYGAAPRTWLVVLVDEQWDSWCKVVVQLQNDQNNQNTDFTADSDTPADSTQSI